MKQSLYEILGVPRDAPPEDIKKAYYTLSKKHHPDKEGAHERMVEINRAYTILSNVDKRKRYDETGMENTVDLAARFQGYVNEVFMKIVAQSDVDHNDVLVPFKTHTESLIGQNKGNITQWKDAIKKIKNVQKRMVVNNPILDMVLKGNVQAIDEQIGQAEDNVLFLEYALDLIKHCKYKADKKKDPEPQEGGFYTFLSGFSSI
jgi:curved DNA-binding protein CbpA